MVGVVGHREGTHAALGAPELLHEDVLGPHTHVDLAGEAELLRHRLGVDVGVWGDGDEEEAVLLVLEEEILRVDGIGAGKRDVGNQVLGRHGEGVRIGAGGDAEGAQLLHDRVVPELAGVGGGSGLGWGRGRGGVDDELGDGRGKVDVGGAAGFRQLLQGRKGGGNAVGGGHAVVWNNASWS